MRPNTIVICKLDDVTWAVLSTTVIKVNNRGLRTRPWGTPHFIILSFSFSPAHTVWGLSVRKSNIQLLSGVFMPSFWEWMYWRQTWSQWASIHNCSYSPGSGELLLIWYYWSLDAMWLGKYFIMLGMSAIEWLQLNADAGYCFGSGMI